MNLEEKFALGRHVLLFLALLIPAIAGPLAAGEDQPGGDHVLIIDVYSGAVAPDATQAFWLWLETLKKVVARTSPYSQIICDFTAAAGSCRFRPQSGDEDRKNEAQKFIGNMPIVR